MTRYRTSLIATIALLTTTIAAAAAGPANQAGADKTQVTETVRSMFAALAANDADKFRAVLAPDFYAFDVGKRFTGDALLELIKTAHAAGNVYVWTVNEPDVHISGDIAWIAYVNRGSITDASGTENVTWLESAVLQKEKGAWRIRFLHSTRAVKEGGN
ncbi:MAG TPA: nuclear transport factor 2 family protein [Chthoniobacterales bacterium]|nr:nuclear transport factor 2 family protein [Chthoniobacterales bacterium]